MTVPRRASRLPVRVRSVKPVIDTNEVLQGMTMPDQEDQVLTTKDVEQSRLPVLTGKSPHKTTNLETPSPGSSMIRRSQSQNVNVPSMRVRFVDSARRKDREGGTESSGSSTSSQHNRVQFDQCSATISKNSDWNPDGTCGLRRRQTDAARTTRSANGITLRRTSSNGSEKATVENWEPWQRSSLSAPLVAKGSKTSLSRHQNVPCVEVGTKAQKDERERALEMTSGRQRAAIAPQMTMSRALSEDVECTEADDAEKTANRNDSTIPDPRADSIGEVKPVSAPKATFAREPPGSSINPRDSSLPELYSGSTRPSGVANAAEQIACFDWHTRQGSLHYGVPPGENQHPHDLNPVELEANVAVSTIEPDQDFTTQLGARKPRQLTSTPEQMEKLRKLWKEDRDQRGFAGEARIKLRRVLSKITRLMPGTQDQTRMTTLPATSPDASVLPVAHRNVANDLVTSSDAKSSPATPTAAELEASQMRNFRFPSRDLTGHVRQDQRYIEHRPVPGNSSTGNGEVFELSAEPKVPSTNTNTQDTSFGKSRARNPSLPVSPTTVLFAPTATPLPPISPPQPSLSRAWSVLGTTSTARHERMASPLPPMPSQPQLRPLEHNHGPPALAASSTYHRAGPFIYNEGHMRSLADFSLSEVQRYWLRAQADAQADVMEGWMPWGL